MTNLSTRLDGFSESIIRKMTRISNKYGAINLSQGFPDFDPPKQITDRLKEVADYGPHQYSVTWGAQNFRESLAKKQSKFMGLNLNPDENVVVTCGSTEAMMTAMMSVCNPGDKVIVFSPLLPLTKLLTGTQIGPIAASVPITIASIAFFARLSEGAFNEIDPGIIEAAISSGSGFFLILKDVLIVEALPSLIRAVTVNIISLIGFSAMAGIVGGGGIGDLAIRYGYYRYETGVMIVTVILLVVLVQVVQIGGDFIARKSYKK